jgi:hypothetical protein
VIPATLGRSPRVHGKRDEGSDLALSHEERAQSEGETKPRCCSAHTPPRPAPRPKPSAARVESGTRRIMTASRHSISTFSTFSSLAANYRCACSGHSERRQLPRVEAIEFIMPLVDETDLPSSRTGCRGLEPAAANGGPSGCLFCGGPAQKPPAPQGAARQTAAMNTEQRAASAAGQKRAAAGPNRTVPTSAETQVVSGVQFWKVDGTCWAFVGPNAPPRRPRRLFELPALAQNEAGAGSWAAIAF